MPFRPCALLTQFPDIRCLNCSIPLSSPDLLIYRVILCLPSGMDQGPILRYLMPTEVGLCYTFTAIRSLTTAPT
jgi:hypothetical protein